MSKLITLLEKLIGKKPTQQINESKESTNNKKIEKLQKPESLSYLLKLSEHWNGYKREEAVKKLCALNKSEAIPKLILRANDWVPEVRKAALESITSFASKNHAEAFVLYLPDLYHLRNCARNNHEDLINYIEQYLVTNTNSQFVIQGINNENELIARACITLCIDFELIDPVSIVKVGLQHNDIIVRAKSSYLLRKLTGIEQVNALKLALKDSFMPIRREAFQICLKTDESVSFIEPYLYDRHSSIREIALKKLQLQSVDIPSIYEKSLKSSLVSKLKCSIWGLGFLKCKDISHHIFEFLQSPYPSVRKQSLSTLSNLYNEEFNLTLVKYLQDPSPAVCKEVTKLCDKQNIVFTASDLIKIMELAEYEHIISNSLAISKHINKWERFIFLLRLLEHKALNSLIGVDKIREYLFEWNEDFNKTYCQPSMKQLKIMETLYLSTKPLLGTEQFNVVLFTLKTLGIHKD
ncbi:hypothetical protein KO527_10810 [Pseudoalteromonas sp. C2R02]|uniref:HEAT repeat domain-containing protein n=1 Tax=Pseudoalteromonas sp. C2R02 TaxID=2841565 RepID=UPI001C095166|nr:HEAT repeat domain-containing protein [Pseudoalteromonas sp. C2R02]MBU2969837.1 hypothetical protein [Pseudoalteromonas sp. C2R02]